MKYASKIYNYLRNQPVFGQEDMSKETRSQTETGNEMDDEMIRDTGPTTNNYTGKENQMNNSETHNNHDR